MDVAIAYVNPSGGFISEGWWTLARGGCKTVLLPSDTSDHKNVFYYQKAGALSKESRLLRPRRQEFQDEWRKTGCDVRNFLRQKVNIAANATSNIPKNRRPEPFADIKGGTW